MAETLWENIFRKKLKEESLHQILKGTYIFSALSKREIKNLEKIVHRRRYKPGEIIFNQNDPGAGMYVIVKGRVKIFLKNEKGEEIPLTELGKGDFFGETAVIDRRPRSASAMAVEATELIGFFRPDLMDIIERSPSTGAKILFKIAEVFSERLRRTNAELMKARKEMKKGKK